MIWLRKAGGLLLFFGNSLTDIKRRRISLIFTGLAAVCGAAFFIGTGGLLTELLPALLPGTAFVLLSLASRGGIGMGDGIVLLAAGFFRTWQELLAAASLAAFLAGGYAAVLFFIRRRGEERFAFVPFLFLADLIVCLAGGRV